MKNNERRNIISSIQKNLKDMQEEAQSYIDKNHASLPPICKARHYLIQSLSKNGLTEIPSMFSPNSQSPRVLASHKTLEPNFQRTSVYNLQFTKKSQQKPLPESPTVIKPAIMNSTSLKLRIANKRKQNISQTKNSDQNSQQKEKTKEKIKTITLNPQVLEEKKKQNHKFKPSTSKTEFWKKQEVLKNYFKTRELKASLNTQSKTLDMELDDLSKQLLDSQVFCKNSNTENIRRRKNRHKNTIQYYENRGRYLTNREGEIKKTRKQKRYSEDMESYRIGGRKNGSKVKMSQKEEECTPWGHQQNAIEDDFDMN